MSTMSERSAALDRLTYLLVGAGIGATLALLFAPKSGRELRGDLAELSRKGAQAGRDAAHRVGEKVGEGVEAIRDTASRQKSQIATAIEAGKQAYREEREKA
jgi:gas vesicle protein